MLEGHPAPGCDQEAHGLISLVLQELWTAQPV